MLCYHPPTLTASSINEVAEGKKVADNEQESRIAEGKWNRTGFVCHNCTAHRWEHLLETENAAPSRVPRTHTSPQTHAGRARREPAVLAQ